MLSVVIPSLLIAETWSNKITHLGFLLGHRLVFKENIWFLIFNPLFNHLGHKIEDTTVVIIVTPDPFLCY